MSKASVGASSKKGAFIWRECSAGDKFRQVEALAEFHIAYDRGLRVEAYSNDEWVVRRTYHILNAGDGEFVHVSSPLDVPTAH